MHSVLLCTSFRAHRINNCCAHCPRGCVLGGHSVCWCDFSFQKIGVCSHPGERLSHERMREFQQGGDKRPRGFWNARYQLHQNERKGSVRILHTYFLLREVTSKIFLFRPLEWVSRAQISPMKVLRFKSCLFVIVLGSGDGEMRYAALFLVLNFNLGWFFSHTLITYCISNLQRGLDH